jgi:hypothetical protein
MVKLGYNSYIGFASETAFGTFANPAVFTEYNSEGFDVKIDEVLVSAVNGTAQYKKRLQGKASVDFSIEAPVVPGSLLKLISNALGDGGTVTTYTATVYQWVFVGRTANNSRSLSFQVNRDLTDSLSTYNYTGGKINTMAFNMNAGDVLKATISGMCKSYAAANTVSTAAYRAFNPYIFKNGTIAIGDTLAAATSTTFESINIEVSNNLKDQFVVGSAYRDQIEAGMQTVKLTVNKPYADATLYNRYLNGTKTYISALFTAHSITAVVNHSVKFEFANCYANNFKGNIGSAGDLVKQSMDFNSLFEDSSVTSIKVTVITDLATL